MLRWTDGPDDESVQPIEGVPTVPRASALTGGALVYLAALMPVRLLPPRMLVPGGTAVVLGTLSVAVLYGLGLILIPKMRGPVPTVIGLVVLDLIPVAMVAASAVPSDQRARALWLVIPTVIAATNRALAVPAAQTVAACAIAAGIILSSSGDVQPRAVLECFCLGGVLAMAAVVVARLAASTREQAAQLWQTSLTDGLTGVLNRRGLIGGFPALVREAERRSSVVGVVLLDVDHFKRINDEFGHTVGDQVLRRLCGVTADVVGDRGLLARTGGEELAAVLAGPPEELAGQIRDALATSDLQHPMTVSIGVVSVAPDAVHEPERLWDLLDAADRALYRAKQDGRDRIRRGAVDFAASRPPTLVPPPAAAVPPPVNPAPSRDAGLYGWGLVYFSALALIARFGSDAFIETGPAAWVLLIGSVSALVIGAWLLMVRPVVPTWWLLVGALGADAVIAAGILVGQDIAGQRLALSVAVIPGLLVSLYLRRGVVLAHHVLMIALCGLATWGPLISPVQWVAGVLTGAATIVGSAEMMYRLRHRHDVIAASLHGWSVTDPLTGVANRRGLALAFDAADRSAPLRVLVLDVDDFKAVNDRHGHITGDDALARLALTLTVVSPPGSIVARTGGDEFVILSPGQDDGAAERIRGAAALLPVPLSVTLGAVQSVAGSDTGLWDLVTLADIQLTDRKRAKNRRGRRQG